MNIYTVIPARGGSKSIPMKNIRPLHGKPLLHYSIHYSLSCPLVKQTIVSTDSPQIAEIAQQEGAQVPFLRPAHLAEDLTQDFPVFQHALHELEKIYQEQIDLLVLLRPTSPLRPPGLIEQAVALLQQHPQATSVRSVAPTKEHPYRQWQEDGPFIRGVEEQVWEPYNLPRQLLPTRYFQTGDLEMVRRETLLAGSISGARVLPLIIAHEQMVDIDHESDLQNAERRIHNS
ncbi:cytidylyltransferase domain-containing protein [Candidatus Magnetaquicoccus inordinatus]|uniref:acylneuraminate cytidylyltransferase family protein n=1 Tax=Candidatus Magnetaquicoccus inordinatus TaxID=2496818 RepID=UPI00102C2508|nr:acylneuraminate cytidylyltransferase family protein [Candidatus Magnetaquicoccus inordinatus]